MAEDADAGEDSLLPMSKEGRACDAGRSGRNGSGRSLPDWQRRLRVTDLIVIERYFPRHAHVSQGGRVCWRARLK